MKKLNSLFLTLATLSAPVFFTATANAQTSTATRLCVNGSSQVFARTTCLSNERAFNLPTTTNLLNLSTCRRISTSVNASIGVATAAFQCDANSEFVLEHGHTLSNGFNIDALVQNEYITYASNGNLPVGVTVKTIGSSNKPYRLTLTATCCRR
jgi:hypothetical protein